MAVQWAHLGEGNVLVASSDGAWVQRPQLGVIGPLALRDPMPASLRPSIESTRHLLDGAIVAAERLAAGGDVPEMTALRWAWHLVSQWHCAHHSVSLLPELIARCEAAGRADLAAFAQRKLDQEHGHDQFALADLRALGYDAEGAVAGVPPAPSVREGLEYARSCVRGEKPAEFFGYMYALERRVLEVSDEWLGMLAAVLPSGADATSGIRAHANELDGDHVDQAVAFVARLAADDRSAVATGCYRTTQICCARLPGQLPSEEELERWLSPFQRADAVPGGLSGRKHQGGRCA
jgi:pyrroloquinoline quinone (PQQ) biosynthesis protein C